MSRLGSEFWPGFLGMALFPHDPLSLVQPQTFRATWLCTVPYGSQPPTFGSDWSRMIVASLMSLACFTSVWSGFAFLNASS